MRYVWHVCKANAERNCQSLKYALQSILQTRIIVNAFNGIIKKNCINKQEYRQGIERVYLPYSYPIGKD